MLAVHLVKDSGIILEFCSEVAAIKAEANARLVKDVILW